MPVNNQAQRGIINGALNNLIQGADNAEEIVKRMAIVSQDYPVYGVVNETDFRDLSPLFARLFAYNNKHYFIYKAISNPNKIGYLSRKQYMYMQNKKKSLDNKGISGTTFHNIIRDFLAQNGTMGSPYKLLKRAFKENYENTKALARLFPLEEDGKTTKNEEFLIKLCDTMMQLHNGIEIKEASIQECYDLDFHGSNINGSSTRCATNSCMYGKRIGGFYEAFGVKGRMIYNNGIPVGRFLLWPLPDGKQYVDRLYVRGEYMKEALAAIDRIFDDKNTYKYPYLRDNYDDDRAFMIPLSNSEVLKKEEWKTPYIDTFPYLYKDDFGKYYLCNTTNTEAEVRKKRNFIPVQTLQTVHNPYSFSCCPYCNKVSWSGERNAKGQNMHKLYCDGYTPRTKELQAYLKIFRKGMKTAAEAMSNEQERAKFIFEV